MASMTETEFEVRFLDINKSQLIQKLHTLAARDLGEAQLEEVIFYDQSGKWQIGSALNGRKPCTLTHLRLLNSIIIFRLAQCAGLRLSVLNKRKAPI
jgi:hypothetical protein